MRIEFNNVSKSFRAVRALSDVSCTIPHGHKVALIGPNGSGKSNVADAIRWALGELGVRERFWGVALKPGGPTWFALDERSSSGVLGLPANPVSAMVAFTERMAGMDSYAWPTQTADGETSAVAREPAGRGGG